MNLFLIAQVLGISALIIEMLRFQYKSSRFFFYIEPLLSILYFLQFLLLGAASAYLISALSIIRAFCGVLLNAKQLRTVITLIFIPSYLMIGLYVTDSFINSLPTMAIMFSTLAFLYRDERKLVVRLYMMNNLIWFAYAIPYEAYAHALTCTLTFLSLAISILRYEENYSLKIMYSKMTFSRFSS